MKKVVSMTIVLTLGVATVSTAAEKKMTVTGRVDSGTAMGNIVTPEDKTYSFAADSRVGSAIFKVCKVGDTCTVTGMIEDDEIIQSVTSVKKSRQPVLTISASSQATADNQVKKTEAVEITGTIMQGHDAAGGNFWLNAGKKKQYTLRYVFDLPEAAQSQLTKLADARTKVTVKGTLKTWKDGSAAFDDRQPITIYK